MSNDVQCLLVHISLVYLNLAQLPQVIQVNPARFLSQNFDTKLYLGSYGAFC